ncbi:MAG: iron-containing alcohol dehydrogenase [Proteobacteria bacterium]|nr:MAG: iron-containing alcohol dehydrogenase [Pseudomonadota bacterium]
MPAMFDAYLPFSQDRESIFQVDPRPFKFGPGAVAELGVDAGSRGIRRAALFTDTRTRELPATERALESLTAAGIDYDVFDRARVEPTDKSLLEAAAFMSSGGFDGVVSIGGGSVIDTAKAANLFCCHPADFLDYVNLPIGGGKPVPGPLLPHIACPTTAGTGSESTAVAVFDLSEQRLKTGISSPWMKPDLGVIDPEFTYDLPPLVTASTGFDVLTHAIESYTALPYSSRARATNPAARPPYQGANPHSDSGSMEAIRLGGRYLLRAVNEPGDHEARIAVMYAATLAGVSFGNAGVHIPHAMSYSVAGRIEGYYPAGWPDDHSMCPHGISVIVNAPAAFRLTGRSDPSRHLAVAVALGAKADDADPADAGNLLASRLIEMMRACGVPNGLTDLNYRNRDIDALSEGAIKQQRLLKLSPVDVDIDTLKGLYRDAMKYW